MLHGPYHTIRDYGIVTCSTCLKYGSKDKLFVDLDHSFTRLCLPLFTIFSFFHFPISLRPPPFPQIYSFRRGSSSISLIPDFRIPLGRYILHPPFIRSVSFVFHVFGFPNLTVHYNVLNLRVTPTLDLSFSLLLSSV